MRRLWQAVVVLLVALIATRLAPAQDQKTDVALGSEFKKRIGRADQGLADAKSDDQDKVRFKADKALSQRALDALARKARIARDRSAEPPKLRKPSKWAELDGLGRDLGDFGDFELSQHKDDLEQRKTELQAEFDRLTRLDTDWRAELTSIQAELAESRARTKAKIDSEKATWVARQGELKELLAAAADEDKPLRELEQRVLVIELDVLAIEERDKVAWRDRLSQAQGIYAGLISDLRKQLEPVRDRLGRVERRWAELEAYQLPQIQLPAGTKPGVRTAFEAARKRIQDRLKAIAERQLETREIAAKVAEIELLRKSNQAKVTEYLEKTGPGKQSSDDIQYHHLKSGSRVMTAMLEVAQLHPYRQVVEEAKPKLLATIRVSASDRTEADIQLFDELLAELAGAAKELPDALVPEFTAWSVREGSAADAALLAAESAVGAVLELEVALDTWHSGLVSGIKQIERRGLWFRDPDRFSLKTLSGLPGVLVNQGGAILQRIIELPLEIVAAGGIANLRFLLSVAAIVLGAVLFLVFRRLRNGIQADIDRLIAEDRSAPERLVQLLAITGWSMRVAIPAGIAGFFLIAAGQFSSAEGRLCEAIGRLLVLTSVWSSAARVCLRPAREELRPFRLDNQNAARLYRLAVVGLGFWVVGLLAEMLGATVRGSEGKAIVSTLIVLRDGGLLAVLFLFFLRRPLLTQLFRRADDGGIRFLQGFILLILWPARLALGVALILWLSSYFSLARDLGLIVFAIFGSTIAGVVVRQTLRNEVRHRFVERKDGDERLSLLGDYLEIVEFLAGLFAFLVTLGWLRGLDLTDWNEILGTPLWGEEKGEVQLYDLVVCVVIVYATVAITRRSGRTVGALLANRTNLDRGLRYTLGTLTGYLVFLVGMMLSFDAVHIGFAQFGWMMAAMGVGIGFGLQEIISNFFCGLILLFERPLRVGDIVRTGETLGEVKRITIRSTTVTSFDNIDVIVPNRDFITASITNWTASDRDMRSTLNVGVSYGADLKLVREVLLETAQSHGRVYDDPGPVVYATSFGDSSIDFALVYWTSLDYKRSTLSDLHFAVDAAFRRHDIEIPFPQRDVHVKPTDDLPMRVSEPGVLSAPKAATPKPAKQPRKKPSKPKKAAESEKQGEPTDADGDASSDDM